MFSPTSTALRYRENVNWPTDQFAASLHFLNQNSDAINIPVLTPERLISGVLFNLIEMSSKTSYVEVIRKRRTGAVFVNWDNLDSLRLGISNLKTSLRQGWDSVLNSKEKKDPDWF